MDHPTSLKKSAFDQYIELKKTLDDQMARYHRVVAQIDAAKERYKNLLGSLERELGVQGLPAIKQKLAEIEEENQRKLEAFQKEMTAFSSWIDTAEKVIRAAALESA